MLRRVLLLTALVLMAVREDLAVTLTVDADRTVFSMIDSDGHAFTGHFARTRPRKGAASRSSSTPARATPS